MIRHRLFVILILILSPLMLMASEVVNIRPQQVGNRILFEYDLTGDEEADVTLTLTIKGEVYTQDRLHLEGDYGKVKPGKNKKIYWNLLQDFPRGLSTTLDWELEAGGKIFKDPTTGMEFVFVRGGCYDMGDTFGDGNSDERPVHNVCVSDFYIGRYEVTQGQWKAIMGNNPSFFTYCGDNCPLEDVSWDDVQTFIDRLNTKTGKRYRLPTEAEWEYAARSGGKREKYAGTSSDADLDSYAWYGFNSGGRTHPVGTKKPNGLGIYDMSGNVWEWVSDWHSYGYYENSPRNNPQGPSSGSDRIGRGGGWYNGSGGVRASSRYGFMPSYILRGFGFRLALTK